MNPAKRPDDLRLHLTVLRCQSGDDRAFAQLMAEFGSRTLAYLGGVLGDDAEDVQQEVWLTVYRRIGELANPSAFRTWLFRVTRHRAIDSLRKRKRERELLVDVMDEIVEAVGSEGAPEPHVDEDAFDAVLAALPPPQREVLLLRYRDDLSYDEIAVVVGVPIGTVRTRLHHAKRKLNERMTRGSS